MKQIKLKKLNYYSPEIRTKASRIALIGIYISIALLETSEKLKKV